MAITVYWRPGDWQQNLIEQTDGNIGQVNLRDISPDFWSVFRSVQLLLRGSPVERFDDGRRDGDHGWRGRSVGLRGDNARDNGIDSNAPNEPEFSEEFLSVSDDDTTDDEYLFRNDDISVEAWSKTAVNFASAFDDGGGSAGSVHRQTSNITCMRTILSNICLRSISMQSLKNLTIASIM